MADIGWHPAAEADYQTALAWYLERSSQAAQGFETAVERALQFIAQMPLASPLVDDTHRRCGVRRYPYALIYRIDGDQVAILAVAHDHQLPGFWASRN